MIRKLYNNRFELFLSSQVAILFGSLVVPPVFFENILEPLLFLINLLAGVVLISGSPKLMWFSICVLVLNTILFGISTTVGDEPRHISLMRLSGYFLFYVLVTVQIIKQVWYAKRVNKNVIFGLTSGYISLGLIGFFIFLTIELVIPGSFQGGLLLNNTSTDVLTDKLMYFSLSVNTSVDVLFKEDYY